MPLPTSPERVRPVSSTARPCCSSHSFSMPICVERPTPSVPSMTMSLPTRSCRSRPGSLTPYVSFMMKISRRRSWGHPQLPRLDQLAEHELAHLLLLDFDGQRGINHCE